MLQVPGTFLEAMDLVLDEQVLMLDEYRLVEEDQTGCGTLHDEFIEEDGGILELQAMILEEDDGLLDAPGHSLDEEATVLLHRAGW